MASVVGHDKLIRRAPRWHGQRGDVAARTGRPATRGRLSEETTARASRRGSPGTLAAKTAGAYNTRSAADKRVARSLNTGALIALLSGVVSSGDGGHVGCGRPQRKVSETALHADARGRT